MPTARASGLAGFPVVVDTHERYPYRFVHQQVEVVRRALPCGDYAVEVDGRILAAVERKSLEDLTTSLTSGRLRYAVSELAALPRAAVVVEDRYSRVFASEHVKPSVLADGLAELQIRYPNVPVVFCETRGLAEEWTYRYLAAALAWAGDEEAASARVARVEGDQDTDGGKAPRAGATPAGSTREIRRWALDAGLPVSDRGRLRPDVVDAWRRAHLTLDAPAEVDS